MDDIGGALSKHCLDGSQWGMVNLQLDGMLDICNSHDASGMWAKPHYGSSLKRTFKATPKGCLNSSPAITGNNWWLWSPTRLQETTGCGHQPMDRYDSRLMITNRINIVKTCKTQYVTWWLLMIMYYPQVPSHNKEWSPIIAEFVGYCSALFLFIWVNHRSTMANQTTIMIQHHQPDSSNVFTMFVSYCWLLLVIIPYHQL